MAEIEFDKLIEAASNKDIGKNASDIKSMLQDANKFLTEAQKTADLISGIFQKIGLPPSVIARILGKTLNVPDIDKPLAVDNSIVPTSALHKDVINQINGMSAAQLEQFLKVVQNAGNNTEIKKVESK